MPRVLVVATTTGYQVRSFGDAARRAGIELALATDRCKGLDDPWHDAAIPIRFHDEWGSVDAIVRAAADRPIDGVVAVGDRPTAIAALATRALGRPTHPIEAVRRAGNKGLTRAALTAAGLPSPWFVTATLGGDAAALARAVSYPCVLKPLALSGSRGVIRANDIQEFEAAFARLRRLLAQKDVRAMRDSALDHVIVEGYIPGAEFAVEAVLDHGILRCLAVFDKPDPLHGPYFEETIYVTPSGASEAEQRAMTEAVAAAANSLGLWHGPVHAECRVSGDRVVVLEVAARPIGGLCARALRFIDPAGAIDSLESLLLRHAVGESLVGYERESDASGVMMIPIPRRGRLRGVAGLEAARAVADIDEIRITAKLDHDLIPLPEGASYLGFIFARAATPAPVVDALRAAHAVLEFEIDAVIPVG